MLPEGFEGTDVGLPAVCGLVDLRERAALTRVAPFPTLSPEGRGEVPAVVTAL